MHVFILLDRSGSMGIRWVEAIGAVNGYVEALHKAPETADAKALFAVFDSAGPGSGFEVLRTETPVSAWKKVEPTEITPRGGTPLYDAIGKIVTEAENAKPDKATIVVMTDGAENQSREMTKDAARAALDRCRAKGWDIVFLGADFDAMGQGASLGNAAAMTLNASGGSYLDAAQAVAAKTAHYAATGTTRGFLDSEREAAAGKNKGAA